MLKKVKTHTLYIHNIKYLLNFIHYVYLNLITSITSSMKAKINKSNDNNHSNEYQQVQSYRAYAWGRVNVASLKLGLQPAFHLFHNIKYYTILAKPVLYIKKKYEILKSFYQENRYCLNAGYVTLDVFTSYSKWEYSENIMINSQAKT